MKILTLNGNTARCGRQGIERDVDVFLLSDYSLSEGDYVLVHVGYAIQKVDPIEAETRWELFDKMQRLV